MTDPIADMLTRIRNAIGVNQTEVTLPYARIKEEVANSLKVSGFLKKVETQQNNGRKNLRIIIRDSDEKNPITAINRISRPGRRTYAKSNKIPVIKRGRGIVIISTSRGIMTGQQAKTQKLGGELICKVY